MRTRRFAIIAAVVNALLLTAAAFVLLRNGTAAPEWHGTAIQPPMPPRPFTLQSEAGPIALSDLAGDVVVLYFGYTSCPDACPLTLAKLAQVRRSMPAALAADVRVVLVSVDPERDTPQRLAEYVAQFDSSFIGVTGTRSEIEAIAQAYGIYHDRGASAVDPADPLDPAEAPDPAGSPDSIDPADSLDSPDAIDPAFDPMMHAGHEDGTARAPSLIDHTTHVLVLDRSGRLALLWSLSIDAEQMEDDLRRLLRT